MNITTETLLLADKRVTRSVNHWDANYNEVLVTRNGLLQTHHAKTGWLLFRYAYDPLGRRTGVTDARGLTTTTAYRTAVPKGAIDYEQDSAKNVTAYGYDAATGRMTSIQRPGQKMQYFAYTARGELEKTWGDTPYPVMITTRTDGGRKMHTFQGGSSWNADTWPAEPGTADVTWGVYQETTCLLTTKTQAYGTPGARLSCFGR